MLSPGILTTRILYLSETVNKFWFFSASIFNYSVKKMLESLSPKWYENRKGEGRQVGYHKNPGHGRCWSMKGRWDPDCRGFHCSQSYRCWGGHRKWQCVLERSSWQPYWEPDGESQIGIYSSLQMRVKWAAVVKKESCQGSLGDSTVEPRAWNGCMWWVHN